MEDPHRTLRQRPLSSPKQTLQRSCARSINCRPRPKDLALTLIEEISVRRTSVCFAALLLSACSGGETEETNNMMAPPSDIRAPNSNVETEAERDHRLREKAQTDPDGA